MKDWLDELARDTATFALERGRPLVTLAFALSADACLAEARGSRTHISDHAAARLTHTLRAMHGAVLIGIETAIADDPMLTTRLVEGPTGLRIVLDSRLRLPFESALLAADPMSPLIVATEGADEERARELGRRGAVVLTLPSAPRGVSLEALLLHLVGSGISSVMVEGGARIIESFLGEGLVDHLCITSSPRRFDSANAVRFSAGLERDVIAWVDAGGRRLGNDTIIAGRFARFPRSAAR